LLQAIQREWSTNQSKIVESGEQLVQLLRERTGPKAAETGKLDARVLSRAYEQFHSQFDPDDGGFGPAPKFPRSHSLSFLLRYWKRSKEPPAIAMVETTLEKMAKGGMYDQIGGGFHRYSTDAQWHVPHFEKMLYDQALLSKTYLEAYQALGTPSKSAGFTEESSEAGFEPRTFGRGTFGKIAREIFDYVLREMTGPSGGFYSAEDADSLDPEKGKKSEGAFYLWKEEEITEILGKENAAIFNYYFDVHAEGNAANDPQGEFTGKNILRVIHSIEETAEKFGRSAAAIEKIIQESKERLRQERSKRPRPHLDDKILTDWNGLMISSLAFGSRVLGEPRYAEAARKAADFILSQMKRKDGRLMHRFRDGETAVAGFVEDYAFFILGLVDLYEATFDAKYLKEAKFLSGEMIRLFWDKEKGGFFFSGSDTERLIIQTKEIYDGAIPSGNSAAALSLLRVARLTMNRELEKSAEATLETFSDSLSAFPSGYPFMLMALDFALGPSREIVIAGDLNSPETQRMLEAVYKPFQPNTVVAFRPSEEEKAKEIISLAPFLKNQEALQGKTTVYVCQNHVCDIPVTDVAKLEKALSHSI
jgi:uncharacterized protein YyaL (SSP411 family)